MAQKIQVKDDILLKDKKPIARIEGESVLGAGEYRQYFVLRKVVKFQTSEYEDEFVQFAFLDTHAIDLTPGKLAR